MTRSTHRRGHHDMGDLVAGPSDPAILVTPRRRIPEFLRQAAQVDVAASDTSALPPAAVSTAFSAHRMQPYCPTLGDHDENISPTTSLVFTRTTLSPRSRRRSTELQPAGAGPEGRGRGRRSLPDDHPRSNRRISDLSARRRRRCARLRSTRRRPGPVRSVDPHGPAATWIHAAPSGRAHGSRRRPAAGRWRRSTRSGGS